MAGSITDINKRKQTETELYKYKEKLEELVEERTAKLHATQKQLIQKERLATLGQLTATVSHEIRNPLAAIQPSLYIVNKLAGSDNPQLIHAIERINRNINRCDHIIDELLDFTRITTLETAKTNFDNWLSNTINDHHIPPGITTELDLNLGNLQLNIDPGRMQRAIINLVDNAIHAMTNESTGTIINGMHLSIKTEQFENNISITISDTGHGIPAENIEKIFEPLFSTNSFGVGLRMPAVKQIIHDHNGTIAVNSAINNGTTITLTLPSDIQERS
jgi:signal transduction histidine kinase